MGAIFLYFPLSGPTDLDVMSFPQAIQSPAIRDLFDLPERVNKSDFVLELTSGVEQAQQTVETYVPTPGLVDAFDRSLHLVGSALRDARSKASYLHGSFGSGKSHFMAMLSLLLADSEAAWRLPEFHPLREKHAFLGKKKLLQLHFHMIGAESLEQKLLGGYVEHVRKHHPEADLPGVYADEELFDNARSMMEKVGEEKFLGALGGEKKGWGALAQGWTRERFEAHATSTDLKLREALFSKLVSVWFPAYTEAKRFVDIDSGLAALARHAQGLGYDGVVLFLDELILWLSHRASEAGWLHNEVQKIVKLVESQDSSRALPIVSFIARQRNLAEMVGKMHSGAENQLLHDSLAHWEGRFDTITLEDRDLPAIVEKRILKPRGPEVPQLLDDAFAALRREAGSSFDTLLGQQDAAAFRKLYPFSPALVSALVALSNTLQRQRTAIKLLMELLVEHMGDLRLGEVVRVGDLFDVLAGGEEPADGVMRARFASAKEVYKHQLLPLIQESNGTNTPERCQRLRPEHPLRLGCSGCKESQCRTDNRLVKTLLIAALVPEVPELKELTASRLYQLNHGSIKVMIRGTEASVVTQKLRKWAASIAQLHVGSEKDPTVAVRLEGVDLKPILERYAREDSAGARQRLVREVLFEALGMDAVEGTYCVEKLEWRGTRRSGAIVFGNVRALRPEMLRCEEEHDFRLVIDYPFDDAGKTPNDDLAALERFQEQESSWTLVWIPHFFSESINQLLGELVVLGHILGSRDTQREAVSHLTVENQSRALNDLDSLRRQKKSRLLQALGQAYGLERVQESDIDSSQKVERHLLVLRAGAQHPQPELAANLATAKDKYIEALLAIRYPRHPHFTKPLTPKRVESLVETFASLVAAEGNHLPADRELRGEMLGTLAALGLVRCAETSIHLVEDKLLAPLDRRRIQEGVERPRVDEVRAWLEEGYRMGLQPEAEDLVVRCYALWARRTLEIDGRPYDSQRKSGALPGYAVLEKPELPSEQEWLTALNVAGQCFGVALAGRYRSPDNLNRLRTLLDERLERCAAAVQQLPALLEQRAAELGLGGDFDRFTTAAFAARLVADLRGQSAVEQVRVLAASKPVTSGQAVGRHTDSAPLLVQKLGDDLVFGVFAQLRGRANELPGAAEVVEEVARAVRQDELHQPLATRLAELALRGQRLLSPAAAPARPEPTARVLASSRIEARGVEQVRQRLSEVVAELEARLAESDVDDVELVGSLTLRTLK